MRNRRSKERRLPVDVPAGARYDRIGATYSAYRRPDPRIASLIERALDDSQSVLDVGSGTGSYEPLNRGVVAVEPSWTMIRQRPAGSAPVVRATAERLPFPADSFDAALAVLTIHHWSDPIVGLVELARVAALQIILTWDPAVWRGFWLVKEYLPQILEAEAGAATMSTVEDTLDVLDVTVVPIPADCTDGFCGAYWRRPHRYLDQGARGAISAFARLDPPAVRRAMLRLDHDLADGTWERRHRRLLSAQQIDLGYRLLRARRRAPLTRPRSSQARHSRGTSTRDVNLTGARAATSTSKRNTSGRA